MTSEITEAMVEAAGNKLIGYGTDHGWFRCPAMTEFFQHDPIGHSEFQAIVAQVIEAALAARPAPEAGSVVGCEWCVDGLQADGETPCPCQEADLPRQVRDLKRALAERDEQIASLSAKVAEVERERDHWHQAHLAQMEHDGDAYETLKNLFHKAIADRDIAEARASELQREVERRAEIVFGDDEIELRWPDVSICLDSEGVSYAVRSKDLSTAGSVEFEANPCPAITEIRAALQQEGF